MPPKGFLRSLTESRTLTFGKWEVDEPRLGAPNTVDQDDAIDVLSKALEEGLIRK
jgi:hypothetical protein